MLGNTTLNAHHGEVSQSEPAGAATAQRESEEREALLLPCTAPSAPFWSALTCCPQTPSLFSPLSLWTGFFLVLNP